MVTRAISQAFSDSENWLVETGVVSPRLASLRHVKSTSGFPRGSVPGVRPASIGINGLRRYELLLPLNGTSPHLSTYAS